jgi:hypothetical protein
MWEGGFGVFEHLDKSCNPRKWDTTYQDKWFC